VAYADVEQTIVIDICGTAFPPEWARHTITPVPARIASFSSQPPLARDRHRSHAYTTSLTDDRSAGL